LPMSHILIADDDPLQLQLRKGMIEGFGHEVSTALTACQTVLALQTRTADLVIMDLRLPNADGRPDAREGFALIRSIRELCSEIPLVVLTGWPADLDGHPEAQLVTRVMMKPVKSAVLAQTLRELIA